VDAHADRKQHDGEANGHCSASQSVHRRRRGTVGVVPCLIEKQQTNKSFAFSGSQESWNKDVMRSCDGKGENFRTQHCRRRGLQPIPIDQPAQRHGEITHTTKKGGKSICTMDASRRRKEPLFSGQN
jgi:hypothetical protein